MTTPANQESKLFQYDIHGKAADGTMQVQDTIMLLPYDGESAPPEGYVHLIAMDKAMMIEGKELKKISETAAASRDGMMQAAISIQKLCHNFPDRPTVLRILKGHISQMPIGNRLLIPFTGRFWVKAEDMPRIEGNKGISVITRGERLVRSGRHVESRILFPDGQGSATPGSIPEIDGDSAPPSSGVTRSDGSRSSSPHTQPPANPNFRPARQVPTIGRRGR